MSPRVGEKNKRRRIEALRRLRDFLHRYRRAFALYRAGFRDVFCRVAPESYPSGAPTDPDVRNSRIRLLDQQARYVLA